MTYLLEKSTAEVFEIDNKLIFKFWCYTVTDWKTSREPVDFEKDIFPGYYLRRLLTTYFNLYAGDLKNQQYLVIFIDYIYIVVNIKTKSVSDYLYLPSPTMAFFRNFGD
jgi:hypothetical protein